MFAQTQQATLTQTPAMRRHSLHCVWIYRIPYNSLLTRTGLRFVPQPNLANSPRIDQLVKDGVLELSLKNAIALALENNLDIAIARIQSADCGGRRSSDTGRWVVPRCEYWCRAEYTGRRRGRIWVRVQPGAGAGGTSGGAGGAGSGASGSGLVNTGYGHQCFGLWIHRSLEVLNNEKFTQPLSNIAIYGVPTLQQNTTNGNINYTQAFPTGTSLSVVFDNSRGATNSPNSFLNPTLNSYYHVLLQQQLLAGFGVFGPNLLSLSEDWQRIIRRSPIEAFKLQVISTITQIANMYWDLVAAYDDEQVKSRSLDFANQTLDSDRKQLSLQAIPTMDVLKAEGRGCQS